MLPETISEITIFGRTYFKVAPRGQKAININIHNKNQEMSFFKKTGFFYAK